MTFLMSDPSLDLGLNIRTKGWWGMWYRHN